MIVTTENKGQEITASSYWGSDYDRAGYFIVSPNAGAFRLLVPTREWRQVEEMKTAQSVVISRGPWPAERRDDAFELMFEDRSDSPFALWLVPQQFERLPARTDNGREFVFSAWLGGEQGPKKVLSLPAFYRVVKQIPWMKPW